MSALHKRTKLIVGRMSARYEVISSLMHYTLGLRLGVVLPLMMILLLVALVLGIISSSSFLAPFVYPLF